jgi:hypothetical protein
MPRKTHRSRPEEAQEDIRRRLTVFLPPPMMRFLELEAKRIGEKQGKNYLPSDVVRALITSYYEKRVAGLLVDPND